MKKLFNGEDQKVKYGDNFYYVTKKRKVYSCIEEGEKFEIAMFSVGNYFADYNKAIEVAESELTEVQEMTLPDIDNEASGVTPLTVF